VLSVGVENGGSGHGMVVVGVRVLGGGGSSGACSLLLVVEIIRIHSPAFGIGALIPPFLVRYQHCIFLPLPATPPPTTILRVPTDALQVSLFLAFSNTNLSTRNVAGHPKLLFLFNPRRRFVHKFRARGEDWRWSDSNGERKRKMQRKEKARA